MTGLLDRGPRPRCGAGTVAATLGVLLVSGAARPDAAPDPRLRTVDYRPTLVLPLTAFVGYHVHIEFAPGEYFVNLGAGDTSSLDVGAEGNHLLLKPKQASGGTNLTILTNRRVYFIDYRALARAPRADEAIYSVAFRYPDGDYPAAAPATPHVDAADPLIAPRPVLNRDYWYCGSPTLRPVAAVDDGLQLWLTFAAHAELPAIFAGEPDGTEALVNTHVEDDTIVVHRLVGRLVLRRGTEVGCVVDRSVRLADRRAGSGTTSGTVVRETREVVR